MKINIIAACDPNSVIGVNGKLPFHIPGDLKRFKELTMGHAVIMGRKTFESIGSNPLRGRSNIVIAKHRLPCVTSVNSLDNAIYLAQYFMSKYAAYIIGGERLYTEALPLADRVYLTLVDKAVDVGPEDTVVRFPLDDMQDLFRMESENKRNGFTFTEWARR